MQEDLWSRSHVASYLLPEVCLVVVVLVLLLVVMVGWRFWCCLCFCRASRGVTVFSCGWCCSTTCCRPWPSSRGHDVQSLKTPGQDTVDPPRPPCVRPRGCQVHSRDTENCHRTQPGVLDLVRDRSLAGEAGRLVRSGISSPRNPGDTMAVLLTYRILDRLTTRLISRCSSSTRAAWRIFWWRYGPARPAAKERAAAAAAAAPRARGCFSREVVGGARRRWNPRSAACGP